MFWGFCKDAVRSIDPFLGPWVPSLQALAISAPEWSTSSFNISNFNKNQIQILKSGAEPESRSTCLKVKLLAIWSRAETWWACTESTKQMKMVEHLKFPKPYHNYDGTYLISYNRSWKISRMGMGYTGDCFHEVVTWHFNQTHDTYTSHVQLASPFAEVPVIYSVYDEGLWNALNAGEDLAAIDLCSRSVAGQTAKSTRILLLQVFHPFKSTYAIPSLLRDS